MQLNPAVSKVYEMSLFEGESDGLIQFKLGEDVLCYKISKDYFDKYKEDNDIKNLKSIYVLYGKGKFYVGQAGIRKDDTAITSRIKEHLKDPAKDFVEEIVFFCHSNNRWNGGELDYLEASLIEYFKEQGFPLYKEQNNETKDPYLDQSVQFKYDKHFREIKIMLDILGYDAIRKVISDATQHQQEPTDIPAINTDISLCVRSEIMSINTYNLLLAKRRDKANVCRRQLLDWDITVDSEKFNFASYSNKGHFWMEPPVDVVKQDWTFALFDSDEKEIVVFSIPKNTFITGGKRENSLVIRKDKPGVIKLEIKKLPYIDKQSGVNFDSYIVAKIKFTVE